MVMCNLEESVFNTLKLRLPLYYRYVDDIVLTTPKIEVHNILQILNNYHHKINFTIEIESTVV